MDCKQIAEQDVLERYLLDQLTEQERDDFEHHYFECGACFSQLQTALAVQSQLNRYSPARAMVKGALMYRVWAWTPALVTVVVLLAVGTWWYSAQRHATQQASVHPQQKQPSPISPVAPSLDKLALVEPPPYTATAFRGGDDRAHQQFRAAMHNYSKGNYAKAIPGLRAAVKTDPEVLSFNFYLAACYLLTAQADSAVTFFRKTISLGDPTYSEQSHFYLAKAYLKMQDVSRARDELQATIAFHGSKEHEASEILRQLRK